MEELGRLFGYGVQEQFFPDNEPHYEGSKDKNEASESQGSGLEHWIQNSERHQADCEYIASLGSKLNDDGESEVNNGEGGRGTPDLAVEQDTSSIGTHTVLGLINGDADTSQRDSRTSSVIGEVHDSILQVASCPEQNSITRGHEALRNAIQRLNGLADHLRSRASISVVMPQFLQTVRGDYGEIEQILREIISGELERAAEQISIGERSLPERCQTLASSVKSKLEDLLAEWRDGHIPLAVVIELFCRAQEGHSFGEMDISGYISAEVGETQAEENAACQQAMQNLALDNPPAGFDTVANPLPCDGESEVIDDMVE